MKKLLSWPLAAILVISSLFAAAPANASDDDYMVSIVPGSTINLVSRSSNIPVQIKNNYDVELTLYLHGRALNERATIEKPVKVKLAPMTTTTTKLPVEAVSNGLVAIQVWLANASDKKIGESMTMLMKIDADVELNLLLTFGGVVVALLVLGVIRQFSRNRRKPASGASS
ncbi:MAG: DUF6049 family protein [Rhodoluna sp.]